MGVGLVDHDRRTERGIECFTKPHAYLVWGYRQYRVGRGISTHQNGVGFALARKEEQQAKREQSSDQQMAPGHTKTHRGYHDTQSNLFSTTVFAVSLCGGTPGYASVPGLRLRIFSPRHLRETPVTRMLIKERETDARREKSSSSASRKRAALIARLEHLPKEGSGTTSHESQHQDDVADLQQHQANQRGDFPTSPRPFWGAGIQGTRGRLGWLRRSEQALDALMNWLACSHQVRHACQQGCLGLITRVQPDLGQRARKGQWPVGRFSGEFIAGQLFFLLEQAIGGPTGGDIEERIAPQRRQPHQRIIPASRML